MMVDERLIALGLAGPAPAAATAPAPAPAAEAMPAGVPPLRPAASSMPVAVPTQRAAAFAMAAALSARRSAFVSAAPVTVARPDALLCRPVLLREGRRQVSALLEVGPGGIRLTATGAPRMIGWTGITAVSESRGWAVVTTPQQRWALALALDGIAEPGLSRHLAAVLDAGRRGALDPVGGALHELANASDRVIDTFADADDPIVPLAVGGFTIVAAALFVLVVPAAVALIVRRGVAAGSFAIDPRIAPLDPRALAAAAAFAAALAAWSARYALGDAATVWARGTLRGWHRNAAPISRAVRAIIARLLLSPGRIALAGGLALILIVPSAAARTTIDAAGIHQRIGLPFAGTDHSWSAVVDIVPVAVGIGERPEGFATTFVLADGTRIATRGNDLAGGTERQLFDRARIWARSSGPQ